MYINNIEIYIYMCVCVIYEKKIYIYIYYMHSLYDFRYAFCIHMLELW